MIENNSYSVFVPGVPRPEPKYNAYYKRGRAIIYQRDKGGHKARWKEAVLILWRGIGAPMFEQHAPLSVALEFFLPQAKGNTLQYPAQTPDLDNLAYSVVNTLKGVAYYDDCQIVHQVMVKRWATETNPPGVCIRIGELPSGMSRQQASRQKITQGIYVRRKIRGL